MTGIVVFESQSRNLLLDNLRNTRSPGEDCLSGNRALEVPASLTPLSETWIESQLERLRLPIVLNELIRVPWDTQIQYDRDLAWHWSNGRKTLTIYAGRGTGKTSWMINRIRSGDWLVGPTSTLNEFVRLQQHNDRPMSVIPSPRFEQLQRTIRRLWTKSAERSILWIDRVPSLGSLENEQALCQIALEMGYGIVTINNAP